MTTIEAKIPEPVLKQAVELAEREKISLEQLISLAVTQAVGVWSNESYLSLRAVVIPPIGVRFFDLLIFISTSLMKRQILIPPMNVVGIHLRNLQHPFNN